MNKHTSLKAGGSLIERAAELYGFGLEAPLRTEPVVDPAPQPVLEPEVRAPEVRAPAPAPAPEAKAQPTPEAPAADAKAERKPRPASRPRPTGRVGTVDRVSLAEAGFIVPDAPAGALAEEFRIVKRQLLAKILSAGKEAAAAPGEDEDAAKRRRILICSAHPDEGKTFCAVNLALSLAGERDIEVLLVDADFPKPECLSILGLEGGQGLVDAIADPSLDVESLVIRTDVVGLSVLPAGSHAIDVTELLASGRTREVLARLTRDNPRRIVLFDSPPALMASPASALADHVGQLLMIVRADKTAEADLREAVTLLSACDDVSLLLNGTGFAATGRRFGSYYGYGQ
jgi:exopolysaccharide/PEP-CTERM locus tyrosine autokinase